MLWFPLGDPIPEAYRRTAAEPVYRHRCGEKLIKLGPVSFGYCTKCKRGWSYAELADMTPDEQSARFDRGFEAVNAGERLVWLLASNGQWYSGMIINAPKGMYQSGYLADGTEWKSWD